MKNKLTFIIWLILLLGLCNVEAEITVEPWQSINRAIDHSIGYADVYESRLQVVNALRIDLEDPGLSFVTTPPGDSLDTLGQTTAGFLEEYELDIAVNANFFTPCCEYIIDQPKDLRGLAVSDGILVSESVTAPYAGSCTLLIGADNSCQIFEVVSSINLTGVYNAVAARPILLENGVIQVAPDDDPEPRTAAGISADGKYLYFIVIDGRQPGYSEGATFYEAAQWLQRYGASDGLNLDGGGSSTMVQNDGSGNAVLLNIPSGSSGEGGQRVVGNNIGVYVQPSPVVISEPEHLFADANDTVIFTVAGIGQTGYQWYKSSDRSNSTAADDTVVGGNSDTLTITNIQISDEGYYYCVLSNSYGNSASQVAEMRIKRLVSHWEFENNLDDSVGSNDGYSPSTPVYVTEGVRQTIQFTGDVAQRVIVPFVYELNTSSFTISVWSKVTGDDGLYRASVSAANKVSQLDHQEEGFMVYAQSNNEWSFWTGYTDVSSGDGYWHKVGGSVSQPGPDVINNEWVMITGTYNILTGKQKIYKNGQLVHTLMTAPSGEPFMPNSGTDFFIGAAYNYGTTPNFAFVGLIDDVKYYSYDLTNREIAQLYVDGPPVNAPICIVESSADLNEDCVVDFIDFAIFAADCSQDCISNFAIIADEWLNDDWVYPSGN